MEDAFADLPGFHDKALWDFLERPKYVEVAARFRDADERPRNYWRDRSDIPKVTPRLDEAGCEDLATLLKLYFRQKEGPGHACTVEVQQRGTAYYYFAYPEDHGRTVLEYEGEDDRLRRRLHRPAFDVVLVYDPEPGKLSILYQGAAGIARDLQQFFAREILVLNLPSLARDERADNLQHAEPRQSTSRTARTTLR